MNAVSFSERLIRLFLAHRGELILYAQRILRDREQAEDVVQETYIRLVRQDRDIGPANDRLDEPLGYLYRIVRNLSIDCQRRIGRENKLMRAPGRDNRAEDMASTAPTPEGQAIARDELRLLQQALDSLPERTRIAFEMHRFGGKKLIDIAAHLGVSVGTAHKLVMDALNHCKEAIRRRS